MSEHTPEPLRLFSENDVTAILDAGGNEFVAWMGFDRSEIPKHIHRDRARRLVAAWNACAGIETEELERTKNNMGKFMVSLLDKETAAIKRADEAGRLLAALAKDEKQYRHDHDHYGRSDLRTGNAWDHMRRSGDKARAFLEARHK